MGGMKKWMFGAALAVGVVGVDAVPAQAANFGIYIGTPAAYVPPCPGPGYAWVPGYWDDGYWTPGYWNYVGYGVGPVVRFHGWHDGLYYHRHDFGRHGDRDDRFRR